MPPPNPRVARAFRAMRDIGISEEIVKPVLKKLLKLYDKNWELIEEENYRALADAIFDTAEAEAEEQKKNFEDTEQEKKDLEDEAQVHDVPERPLKRLRLKSPKVENEELPENLSQHQSGNIAESSQLNVENTRVESQPISPQPLSRNKGKQPSSQLNIEKTTVESQPMSPQPLNKNKGKQPSSQLNIENTRVESQPLSPQPLSRNKGKQPVSPKSVVVQEMSDPSQTGAADRTQSAVRKRTDLNPILSPMRLRDRGKEPVSPQIASREKRSNSDRPSRAAALKETKVEAGVARLPRKKMPNTLIKPKEEPVTDDMPPFEAPLAVIGRESSPEQDAAFENGPLTKQDIPEPLAFQCVNAEDKTDGVPASSIETRSNCKLATMPDESSANVEIASLPSGEVKIYLICNSAVGKDGFRMPSVDAVMKLAEDKCRVSYEVLDPNFSVMNLMKDVCLCAWEIGTDSTNESQQTVIETCTIDKVKKSGAQDALASRGMPSDPLNGPVNGECDARLALLQIPRLPLCNGTNDQIHPDKNISSNDGLIEKEKEQNDLEHTNSQSLVAVQQDQITPNDIIALHDVNDIAKGQERVTITVANDVNSESPPSFHYIPQNVVFQNAYLNFSLARLGDDNSCSACCGDCLLASTPCACAHEMGGDFVYTLEGLVKEEFLEECISMNRDPQKHCLYYCKECPLERSKNEGILEPCKGHLVRNFIKECWWKCGCSKQCGNRIVQRGITRNLQVFKTPEGKGWGLRTLEDLPKGTFVCEYVGEVLTNAELYDRVSRSPSNEEHAYPVLLDADWGSEGVLKDEEALCLDATHYGNVARFINHRCFDSNLVEIPVEVETPDHHYYHLAFFTTRKVKALEELTWDYGIDFDDHDHPVKAFRCRCGSKFCRNIKRSRSKSRR